MKIEEEGFCVVWRVVYKERRQEVAGELLASAQFAFFDYPLTSLTSLPASVTTIHHYAFEKCNSIQDFTRIGPYSFPSCDSLRSAMYHFQETNRFRSSLCFWIASLKRRNVPDFSFHPDASSKFIKACNIVLDIHWCDIWGIEELIRSYPRPEINKSLLARYVNYFGWEDKWW